MSTTPEGFVIERCRTEECGAPIVWARTKTGRLMPVDAEPSEVGDVRLYTRQGIVRAEVIPSEHERIVLELTDPLESRWLRTSHFVTCSRAADWRKPR